MKLTLLIMSVLHIFTSTACQRESTPKPSVSSSSKSMIESFTSAANFPTCTSSRKDSLVYSKAERSIYICDGESYSKTFSNVAGDGSAISNVSCATAKPSMPQPTGINGALAFSLPLDVDPCTVNGYVVGKQADLKVEVTQDGVFYVNNVPPGEHDIVVTAGTLKIINALTSSVADVGLRLNQVPSITGIANKLGTIGLQKFGSVSGKATLLGNFGISDFAGITVYIPGTSYSALTDDSGNYSISSVPPGSHNLYFEKDGFGRGQLGNVLVSSEVNTELEEVKLGLSTNVSGTFLVTNSFLEGTTKLIAGPIANVQMIPSSKSVLMMLNHYPNEGLWEPIKTNATLRLNIDGILSEQQQYSQQTYLTSPIIVGITAKFADSNGLESDTIIKNYNFDLFSNGTASYRPHFSVSVQKSPLRLVIDNVVNPPNATRVSVDDVKQFVYTPPSETFESLFSSKSISLKNSASNCGMHQVTLTYEGFNGKVRSLNNANVNGVYEDFSKKALYKCYDEVTDINAPNGWSNLSNNLEGYYASVWTGSKIFVIGFAQDSQITGGLYDPGSNTWSSLNLTGQFAPTVAMRYFRLYQFNDRIVLQGGQNNNGNQLGKLAVYDLTSSTWINTDPSLSQPDFSNYLWSNSIVRKMNSKMYFFSSQGTYNSTTSKYELTYRVFDPNASTGTDPWSADMVVPGLENLTNFASIEINGDLLISGGRNAYGSLNLKSSLLNLSAATFVPKNDLPSTIEFAYSNSGFEGKANSLNSDLIEFFPPNYSMQIIKYSVASDSWSTTNFPSFSSPNITPQIFIGNEAIGISGNAFTFYNTQNGKKLHSHFGAPEYTQETFGLWGVNQILTSLYIPSLKKQFIWGGIRSFYDVLINTTNTTDTRKGILLNLDYPDNWTP